MLDAETLATLGVAMAVVFAFGAAATTLESSVSTKPDDVIDLEYEDLPIGQDEAEDLKKQYRGESTEGDDAQVADEREGDGSETSPGKEQSDAGDRSKPSGGESSESVGGGDGEGVQSGGSGQGQGSGLGGGVPVPDRLLSLLKALLPLVGLALLAAAAYRYRDRILGAIGALFGGTGAAGTDRDAVEWEPGDPANPVEGAWLELLERADVDNPRARTPEECRDAAIASGLDSDAVRTITGVFRDVRYGDRPVTDDRIQRAREGIERIRGGDRGGGPLYASAGGDRT